MAGELTKAHESLARIVALCGPVGIMPRDLKRHHLEADFLRCQRAKLIQHAGYEVSVKADDWLNSAAGRAALRKET